MHIKKLSVVLAKIAAGLFLAGAIAAMALLISLIHLLASLSMTVFLYVFHKAQS